MCVRRINNVVGQKLSYSPKFLSFDALWFCFQDLWYYRGQFDAKLIWGNYLFLLSGVFTALDGTDILTFGEVPIGSFPLLPFNLLLVPPIFFCVVILFFAGPRTFDCFSFSFGWYSLLETNPMGDGLLEFPEEGPGGPLSAWSSAGSCSRSPLADYTYRGLGRT